MATPEYDPVTMRPATTFWRYHLSAPLWAVPFAIFFGLLYGASWHAFRGAYLVALLFTFVIRTALWICERWIVPRLYLGGDPERVHVLAPGLLYALSALVGTYVSGAIVHAIAPQWFATGPVAWAVSGLFALLFSGLFGGIAYARVYYRRSIERAAQVERIRAELARAELRALRAQVNPHFLFNTLNAIAALIAEDPRAAEDVVTRLAEVFRYALTSTDRETVRLGDELEFLHAYLGIERVRLGPRLKVEEHVAPGLEEAMVPPLLLQPLVENAIRYAVAARAAGGTVRVSAERDGALVRLVIADDGPGFTPGAAPSGHGIGLESVRDRMRLAGASHAFTLESTPGAGTRITLTLPFEDRPTPVAASLPPLSSEDPSCA